MRVRHFSDDKAMSMAAAEAVLGAARAKPNLLLCAATGNSPLELYLQLQRHFAQCPGDFAALRVVKLDEWGGLPLAHPATCEHYLQQHLLQPLGIGQSRYFGFDANAKVPEQECDRVQRELAAKGPIDVCVLGMGVNGHIGLNEPAGRLNSHCHVARLAPSTLQHTMVAGMEQKPAYGLTLGMDDILGAAHILLLVTGKGKEQATQQLLAGKVSDEYPVTHLSAHPQVSCFLVDSRRGD